MLTLRALPLDAPAATPPHHWSLLLAALDAAVRVGAEFCADTTVTVNTSTAASAADAEADAAAAAPVRPRVGSSLAMVPAHRRSLALVRCARTRARAYLAAMHRDCESRLAQRLEAEVWAVSDERLVH